jgi:hypothetical protein
VAWGNPTSLVDGTVDDGEIPEYSTGTPYFYVSSMDQSTADWSVNPLASLSLSEAMTGTCQAHGRDPEDPMCARLVMSGEMQKVVDAHELELATTALFQRHPAMESWPAGHGFFVAKLVVSDIWLIDTYGGADQVSTSDYFGASQDISGCCYDKETHLVRSTKCIYSCDTEKEIAYSMSDVAPDRYGGGPVCS